MLNKYSGKIYKYKDGSAVLVDNQKQIEISIPSKELLYVWNSDVINLQIDEHGKIHNVEIETRGITHIIGRVEHDRSKWVFIPEDSKIPQMYVNQKSLDNIKSDNKQIAYAKITSYPSSFDKVGTVDIQEWLGDFDNSGIEIEMAVKKYNLPFEFSKAIEKELEKIPNIPQKKDYKDRVDLTDIAFVTIDGEDARDFDDAVYCEPCEYENLKAHRLLVAIADVSHYVKPKTELDKEAINRATSVYFPRKVIPMLPEKLSNGLCSLNPNVDRLCMVCDMVIDNEGNIKAYQFYNAVIHSKARLTYNIVAEILQKYSKKRPKKLIDLEKDLLNLYDVFKTLFQAREQRGAIDFDTTETQIVCLENGKIDKIIPRIRNDAHKLIEECMLAANVCASEFIADNHEGLFRIHAKPNPEKLAVLQQSLQILGIDLYLDKNKETSTKNIAQALHKIQQRPDSKVLQNLVLRTMQQAVYDNNNIGHYGLAYKAYTHFTSPIRRYPDLLVHRVIKAILINTTYNPNIPKDIEIHSLPTKALQTHNIINNNIQPLAKANKNIWATLGKHCSALERRADEASRDVESWLKCYYMQTKIGYNFTGFVAAVVPFGLFVQLDDLYIDGLVHVSDLGKDYFIYDDKKQEMYGKQSHKVYKIGDKLDIKVIKVDISARKIDFALIKEEKSSHNDNNQSSRRRRRK